MPAVLSWCRERGLPEGPPSARLPGGKRNEVSSMYQSDPESESASRSASATIVSVGLANPPVGKLALLAT